MKLRSLLKHFPLRVLLTCVLGIPLLQVSCGNGKPESAPVNETLLIETGNSMSDSLMKKLGGDLKAALSGGEPASAVKFCAQTATPLTKQTSQEFPNATISRVSFQNRNPANKADETDKAVLKKWETLLSEGSSLPAQELVSVNETTTRFYRPIRVQKLCLSCHGALETLDSNLAKMLTNQYPDDKATGYVEGDLRGAFRVEFQGR